MDGASYAYDGAGNRIQQTVSATVTQYLLDLQPGLATVLQATQGANITSYVHAPRGIHAQKDASGNWEWMLQDGLGSVRSVVDSNLNPLESRLYEPYGVPFGTSGTSQTSYGFTGEQTDGSGQVYLRARYYNPSIGVFSTLDPFEGSFGRPISLNGYSWVEGNVVNALDPSGQQIDPSTLVACESNFSVDLEEGGVLSDGTIQYAYKGRSIKPRRAREKFIQLQLYANLQKGIINSCNPLAIFQPSLTYEDILAAFVGGEMGVLAPMDTSTFDLGVEALGRYYWDYTVDKDSQWDFINTQEGFQDKELWVFLGAIHSFDQTSISQLYSYMKNDGYRAKAREILSGQTNGQDVTNGFNAIGRPINWGNNTQINAHALQRLVDAQANNRLDTNTSQPGTYYEAEKKYTYEIWRFLETPQTGSFVLWSYAQSQCLSRDGEESVAPVAGSGCRKCSGTRANPGNCEYLPV